MCTSNGGFATLNYCLCQDEPEMGNLYGVEERIVKRGSNKKTRFGEISETALVAESQPQSTLFLETQGLNRVQRFSQRHVVVFRHIAIAYRGNYIQPANLNPSKYCLGPLTDLELRDLVSAAKKHLISSMHVLGFVL